MNKWKVILIGLLGMVQLTAIAKPKDKKPEEPKRVYMYGIATNFNDSTVYMRTDACRTTASTRCR